MKHRTNDIAVQSADKTSAPTQNDVSGKAQITPEQLLDMLISNLKTSLGIEPLMIPLKLIRKDGSGEITRGAPVYVRDPGHAKAIDLLVKWAGLPKNTSAETAPTESSLSATTEKELVFHLAKKMDADERRELTEWLAELLDDKQEDE